MKVLIDNGHGADTAGKRSPDGRVMEYEWTRRMADRLVAELGRRGIEAERIVKELTDVSLAERCRRVNAECRRAGSSAERVLVSLHVNAAGSGGEWRQARGWLVYVAPGASAASRRLAAILSRRAVAEGLGGNRSPRDDLTRRLDLAMCRDTLCPAVLTENLFMDSREDVAMLLSQEWQRRIAALHADAIEEYIKQL